MERCRISSAILDAEAAEIRLQMRTNMWNIEKTAISCRLIVSWQQKSADKVRKNYHRCKPEMNVFDALNLDFPEKISVKNEFFYSSVKCGLSIQVRVRSIFNIH